ncbi:MAG: hypothetical protein ABIF77_08815 [bacterium]
MKYSLIFLALLSFLLAGTAGAKDMPPVAAQPPAEKAQTEAVIITPPVVVVTSIGGVPIVIMVWKPDPEPEKRTWGYLKRLFR